MLIEFTLRTFFEFRLPEWAQKEFSDGIMEKIANFAMKLATNTKELARLRSGFIIKDILERFTQKINKSLNPDRSLWIFSGHDLITSNVLNALGVFEVILLIFKYCQS